MEHFIFKTTTKNHYQHLSLKFSMAPSQSPPNSPEVLDLSFSCPIALLHIYCFLCPVFELYINKLYCAPTPATCCISVRHFLVSHPCGCMELYSFSLLYSFPPRNIHIPDFFRSSQPPLLRSSPLATCSSLTVTMTTDPVWALTNWPLSGVSLCG